jgi:hypothetical protein
MTEDETEEITTYVICYHVAHVVCPTLLPHITLI